jgi:hypothetical protein
MSATVINAGLNQTATLLTNGQVFIASGFNDLVSASPQIYNPASSAPVAISFNNLSQTYDGGSKPVAVSTSPAGLPVSVTYNGSSVPPVNAGSYVVVATVNSGGYVGSATNSLFVGVSPITLNGITRVNGGFQLFFTNSPGVNFTVLSATCLTTSTNGWTTRGTATEVAPGVYQFTASIA